MGFGVLREKADASNHRTNITLRAYPNFTKPTKLLSLQYMSPSSQINLKAKEFDDFLFGELSLRPDESFSEIYEPMK